MRKFVLLAVVALLAFPQAASARSQHLKPGKSRWTIKTTVPPGADLEHPKEIAFEDLVGLPDPPGVRKNDPRYRAKRIPALENVLGVNEGDIVATTAWLQLVAQENDGDYHVQVSAKPAEGDNCLIVEVPFPSEQFVKDQTVRERAAQVRSALKALLPGGSEPPPRGVLVPGRVRIRIVGQLFYDDGHVGDPPRGKRGMYAATLWEIHPVTAVEVLSE